MTTNSWLQLALYLGALIALVKPLRAYRRVDDAPNRLTRFGAPLERLLFACAGFVPTRT